MAEKFKVKEREERFRRGRLRRQAEDRPRILAIAQPVTSLLFRLRRCAVPAQPLHNRYLGADPHCEDRVRDGPASGEKGSKVRNWLDCIQGKRRTGLNHDRLGPRAARPQTWRCPQVRPADTADSEGAIIYVYMYICIYIYI